MSCWPACSAWCKCDADDTCSPSDVTINAIRFRTPDGRYLQAASGGGGVMVAISVAAPQTWETFLFVSPVAGPLNSGDKLSLDVCNENWGPAGFLVRVSNHTVLFSGGSKGATPSATYEVGGPDTLVYVIKGFSAGYPGYSGDDPAERIFDIVKVTGAGAANPGVPINSGDQVSLRINSNYGATYYLRVPMPEDGANVTGDGTILGQVDSLFIVEFNEVRCALGWRPPANSIKCQSCAIVRATVTDAATGLGLGSAKVDGQVPNILFSGTAGHLSTTGRVTLTAVVDGAKRDCIPAGNVNLVASHFTHQTKSVAATVPESGAINVPIQLDCTEVSGHVYDQGGTLCQG